MSRACHRLRTATRVAPLIALAAACSAAVAQAPPGAGKPAPAAPDRPALPGVPDTTLYLVLRTGPKETKEGIQSTLKRGLEVSGAHYSGEPSIRSVSPAFFQEFAALVDRAEGVAVSEAKDGVSIRQLPARDTVFELKLAPTQVLKKLTVSRGTQTPAEYTPAAPGAKSPLVLTVPGRYAFTPPAGDPPTDWAAEIGELGKPDTTVKGKWPADDKYYVVTVRGFAGDRQKLFKAVQDPNVVANPFDDVQVGSDLLFAFASLRATPRRPRPLRIDRDNTITISVESIPNRNPKRVWVYFPLGEPEMKAAMEKYQKFNSTQLPEEIRKNAVPATAPGSFGPKEPARWYEWPAVDVGPNQPARTFERKLRLNHPAGDLADMIEKYPRVWMLVVWEFDTGKPEAIMVQNQNDERVYVTERELDGWKKDVTEALDRLKSAPADKDKK